MTALKPILAAAAALALGLGACAETPRAVGPFPDRMPVGSRPGEVVNVLGCPRQGVESGCVALIDANGMAWDIGAARPGPDPYGEFVVELTGRVADRASICQQGPVLQDIQWRYTAVRCPR